MIITEFGEDLERQLAFSLAPLPPLERFTVAYFSLFAPAPHSTHLIHKSKGHSPVCAFL